MDTNEFIFKAKEVHGDKYDYSKIEYKKSKDKVCIICPEHGEFWQLPHSHLVGNGCKKCSLSKSSITRASTTSEFIKKAKNKWGEKYDYSKVNYVNSQTKVCIICPKHGEFYMKPSHHIRGEQCPICAKNEHFEQKREIFKQKFINEIHSKFGDKYDLSKMVYVNQRTNIEIVCPIHGSFFMTPEHLLKSKIGCQKCAKNHHFTNEEYIKKASMVHNNKYDYSKTEYKSADEKICIICPKHGEFWQVAYHHLAGRGCRSCHKRKNQWELYTKLKSDLNITLEFDYSPEWIGRQSLDIYSKEYDFAIEYNGIQHYEAVDYFGGEEALLKNQERDARKRLLCADNNCVLYEIKYDYTDKDYQELILHLSQLIEFKKSQINGQTNEKINSTEDRQTE